MADHTQTGSISFEATNAASLRADGQYESLSDDLRDNYYTKSEFTVAPDKILSTVKEQSEQSARPNLSPYFSHPLTDIYNADENPDGYWKENRTDFWTNLTDGWGHVERVNSGSSGAWCNFYVSPVPNGLKPDTEYTFLVEWRNAVISGTGPQIAPTTVLASQPDCFVGAAYSPRITDGSEGSKAIEVTTIADLSQAVVFSRGYISMPAGTSMSMDVRVSLYEGEYEGPYKPYVDQSLITRVSTAETAIEQNAENILLRATKTEAYQVAQPNLVPWFSAGVPSLPSTYWKYATGTKPTMTDMGDGWVRMVLDNSAGTGTVCFDYDPVAAEGVECGKDYTLLFELRNVGGSGDARVYAVQAGTYGMQFWGASAHTLLQGYSRDCNIRLNYTVAQSGSDYGWAELCDDGVYRKRVVRKSEASDSQYWTRSDDKRCVRLVAFVAAGAVYDAELRFSIYAGTYDGPYKPYAGTQLYASQAQLKVANDQIDLRVEKSGVIAAINASTEAEGGSAVKIQADKVQIDGTAIFTAIEDQLNDAYDAKGAASTVQDNLDNLAIGGRNILRRTGTPFDYAINTTTYGTHHLYSTGSTDAAYDGPMLSDFGLAVGDEVTFTFDWKTSQNGSTAIRYGNFRVEYYGVTSSGTNGYITRMGDVVTMNESNASGHFVRTATLTAALLKTQRMVVRVDNSALVFSVSNAKLEKGNRATDWTPAPEDVTSRTQRIYYRTSSSTAPTSQYMPAAWVTETGDKWAANSTTVANWSAKATKLTNGSGTKYPYLFTCEQRQMGDGTLAYTTVLLDETTTVIDGGSIITGSVRANSLDADSVKANIVQTTDLSATKITSGDIATERMSANVVKAVKAKVSDLYALVAKIGGFVINATSIFSGTAVTSNADNSIALSTADFTRTVNGTSRAGLRFAIGDKFGVTGDGTLYANGANITSINAGNISSGSIGADRIKANVISAVNDGTGTINADKVNVSQITIGESQVTNLTNDLDNKADSSDLTAETSKRKATYGTCSTAAGTAGKVVTCANFELYAGAAVTVTFTTANTAAVPKLNVNSTGAVAVWYNNAAASNDNPVLWGANATLTFVYDGSHWVLDEKPPTYAVACSTAAATRNKAATVTGALVVNGTTVAVSFSTANTYVAASLGFNLSGTGDDVIRVDGAVTSTSNTFTWAANTTLTLVRRGLCWDVTGNDQASKTATTYLTEGTSNGLMVHRKSDATTGVQITDSVEILQGGTSVAEYGATARVGEANGNHVSIDSNAVSIMDGTDTLARFGSSTVIGQPRVADNMVIYLGKDTGSNEGITEIVRWVDDSSLARYLAAIHDRINGNDYVVIGDANGTYPEHGYLSVSLGSHTVEGTGPTGDYAIAEGRNNASSGKASHAEGEGTKASAPWSHAQNVGTIAASNSQTAIGAYNIEDSNGVYAFIIGSGASDTARSNALTVDWNGNLVIAGGITLSTPLADANLPTRGSAGTAGTINATSGATLAVPYVTTDAYGRVTAKGTHTHTIGSLAASAVTSGTFDAARIPSLNASKVNAGTFNAARIPNLNASKINAGTFDSARLPTVPVDKGGTGQTGVTTVTDVASFIAAASGVTVSFVSVTVWGKLVHAYVVAKPDAAKTSAWAVGTVVSAYRPNATATGSPFYGGVDAARILTDGTMQITACGAVEVGVSFTYLLA